MTSMRCTGGGGGGRRGRGRGRRCGAGRRSRARPRSRSSPAPMPGASAGRSPAACARLPLGERAALGRCTALNTICGRARRRGQAHEQQRRPPRPRPGTTTAGRQPVIRRPVPDRLLDPEVRRDRDGDRQHHALTEERDAVEAGALGREPQEDRPVVQVHAVADEPERAQRRDRRARCAPVRARAPRR